MTQQEPQDQTLDEIIEACEDVSVLKLALNQSRQQRNAWIEIAANGKAHEESIVEDDSALRVILEGGKMTPKQTQRLEALAYQYVVEQDHRSCRENHGCCQDDIRDEDLFKAAALAWQKELASAEVGEFDVTLLLNDSKEILEQEFPFVPFTTTTRLAMFFGSRQHSITAATVAALKAALESYKIFPISACDEIRLHADCWGKIQTLEDERDKFRDIAVRQTNLATEDQKKINRLEDHIERLVGTQKCPACGEETQWSPDDYLTFKASEIIRAEQTALLRSIHSWFMAYSRGDDSVIVARELLEKLTAHLEGAKQQAKGSE